MIMSPRGKQAAVSLSMFGVVMGALAYFDERVRELFLEYSVGANGVSTWGERLADASHAVTYAVKHQSIENSPLMLFTIVGVVLFLFMVRT
jgi:hypothetical protein